MLQCATHAPAAITSKPEAAATAAVAVARSARLMPTTTRQASYGKPAGGRRRRGRQRARGVRLGLLLRLRVRLSGLLGLLVRSVEELRCCPGVSRISCSTVAAARSARSRASSSSAAAAAAAAALGIGGHGTHGRRAPAGRDQSSFYAEAIADCLEFIKSRSSYMPAKNAT
uniref:Uncharacterized protein n=1 Tax=Oryza punctata TaxID=4537 RepID=A0A0E0LDM8_ORYPU